MNEAETRALIDEQLKKIGWEVDSKNLRKSKVLARNAEEILQ